MSWILVLPAFGSCSRPSLSSSFKSPNARNSFSVEDGTRDIYRYNATGIRNSRHVRIMATVTWPGGSGSMDEKTSAIQVSGVA